jgi:hypothetical protein
LIVYGANCDHCHETRRVDLLRLRDRLGAQFLVGDIRSKPALREVRQPPRYHRHILWQSASSTLSMSAHRK